MKFGMSIGATEDPTLRNPWDAAYRQASRAEEAGFDMLNAAHHRFTQGYDAFVAGTPDDVIAGLQRAREMTACDVVLGTPSGPDPDEAWKLFTQEVMPVFARDSDADQRGGGMT